VAAARDRVFVEGLQIMTVIGVHARERLRPQPLVVDVELATDARRAAAADDLRLALDYGAVARFVTRYVTTHRPRLLETLAEALALRLLAEFRAPWVRLKVSKPRAVAGARGAGVVLERGRRPAR
jgi:7,8-dihydroneopterin aldolase/epimerase/oxygenase